MAQGYCPCSPRSTCSTLSNSSSVDGLVRNGGFKIKTEFKLSMCENEKRNAPNFELLYEPAVTKFHKLVHKNKCIK